MKNWKKLILYHLHPELRRIELHDRFDHLVESFTDRCSDHYPVRRERVYSWINQFAYKSLEIPEKVLPAIRYFSRSKITQLSRQLVEVIKSNYHCNEDIIYYIPIGGPASGSGNIARILGSLPNVNRSNVIDFRTLIDEPPRFKDKILIFFDDFSGTGETIIQWWEKNATLILPIEATYGIAVLVMNYRAHDELVKLEQSLFSIENLNRESDIFHVSNHLFTEDEKGKLLDYCKRTKCNIGELKGVGECGLLLCFQHGCPDNSIPILWYNNKHWINLFERRI